MKKRILMFSVAMALTGIMVGCGSNGKKIDVTRLISARQATSFERGLYYGKYQ